MGASSKGCGSTRRAASAPRSVVCAAACTRALLFTLVLAAVLAGCGGGGGADTPTGATLPPLAAGESAYDDPASYSTAADASLPGAVEAAAVTRHTLALAGSTINYTARAGHLLARDSAGNAEASVFYVAYSADNAGATAAATRPVTFFYNGGPGSASVWLHLGSFGPKRLVTGVPATSAATPFPLVDNRESLLDVSDLVFIDAVGTGLSQAVTPRVNADFWGVDSDANLFRDFILRWLAVNGRAASPLFLYGESYGGPRSAVLARALQNAGVMLAGVVLQSPALDYNSNCGIIGSGNCGPVLPSDAAVGAFHGRASAATPDLDADMQTLRAFSASRYTPAVAAWLGGAPAPADLPPLLAGYTGIGVPVWQATFNLDPETFRQSLLPNQLIGRYDGRMLAPRNSALARDGDGDPSSNFITPSFASAMQSYLHDTLRYSSGSTYVLTSNAIQRWNFSHAGRSLPDTVPDLQAALAQNPALRVLAMSGYHDLATPFHVTELDLARLGHEPRLQIHNYPGGHMSYLSDATRVRQKADLQAFYAGALAAQNAAGVQPRAHAHAQALAALAARAWPDRAGQPATTRQPAVREAAVQAPLRDPWVPQRLRQTSTPKAPS